jgi:hypothetical protein
LVFGLDPSELPSPSLASSAPGAVAANVPDPSRTEVAAVLDQTTKSRIIPLSQARSFEQVRGVQTSVWGISGRESEPIFDPICAMDTLLKELRPPYGDLAIIRPHGRDWQRKLTFMGTILGSSGGKSSGKNFQDRRLSKSGGALGRCTKSCCYYWRWRLPPPSTRMRNTLEDFPKRLEEFECIRRDLEAKRGKLSSVAVGIADALVPFDATRPWNSVFLYSVTSPEARAFWDEHVTKQAFLSATHSSTRQVTTAEKPHPKTERKPHTPPTPGDREVPWIKKTRVALSMPACAKYNSAKGCTKKRGGVSTTPRASLRLLQNSRPHHSSVFRGTPGIAKGFLDSEGRQRRQRKGWQEKVRGSRGADTSRSRQGAAAN